MKATDEVGGIWIQAPMMKTLSLQEETPRQITHSWLQYMLAKAKGSFRGYLSELLPVQRCRASAKREELCDNSAQPQ